MMDQWPYLVVGVGCVGSGAFAAVKNFRRWRQSQRSRTWPTVPGSVARSKVRGDRDFAVRYRYEVNGVAYQGDVLQLEQSAGSREQDKELADRYPDGAEVQVHYDPADPATAVLIPGGGSKAATSMLSTAVLIAFGLWLSVEVVHSDRARKAEVVEAQAALPDVPFVDLNSPRGVAVAADGNVYVCDGPPPAPSTHSLPELTIGPPAIPELPTGPLVPGSTAMSGRLLRISPDLVGVTDMLPRLLAAPNGVAVGGPGKWYVTDRGQLWVYEVREQPDRRRTEVTGSTPLRGVTPGGVAVDSAATVYVTEPASGRVLRLPAGAETATEIFKLPDNGSPADVAIDNSGNVYVSDRVNNRVLKLAAGGGPVELPFSHLSAPEGVAVDSQGTVYVVDSGNHRIMMLAAGAQSSTDPLFEWLTDPYDVAVDAVGNVFVTDRASKRLLKFAPR